jgi:uncharacterized membrane protein SpoIIM required for sporulation
MKETSFVRQNKEKWLQSEQFIKGDEKDPEKLSTLFVQVVDDLSYSQTFYKYRSVRVYLNTIAREFFSIIYDNKKEKKNRFKEFWLDELPQIVIFCRKELVISLLVFLLSAAIGIFSSANDKDFTASILGDRYVAMTMENIQKGDPMAVYKQANQADMFLGITLNNLMVACRTYVFGIFMSIGTLAILLYNGIMVGSFQYFFAEHNLLGQSAMTIWLHGTLEISAIIIAGGAGLTLGSGLLFPGTYSRLQAFQVSAVRSLKLMMGIAPVIVTAGIIESFLTRYTEVPSFIKLGLIFLSAAFIVGYFIIYPWRKSKTGFTNPITETKLQPTSLRKIDFHRIKNNADILSDAFNFYKRNFNSLIKWILPLTAGSTLVYFLLHVDAPQRGELETFQYMMRQMFFALTFSSPIILLVGALTTSVILYRVFITLLNEQGEELSYRKHIVSWLVNFVAIAALYFFLYWAEGWGGWILILVYGSATLFMFGLFKKESLGKVWDFITSGFSQLMGLQFILFLTLFVFLLILTSPVLYIYTEMLAWNFSEKTWINDVMVILETFIKFFAFYLLLPIVACSIGLLYASLLEVTTASNLKQAIAQIHIRRLKRGMENEE